MKWKLGLGLLLSALFLWLAFRQARLSDVARALASAQYWLMLPAVALTVFAFGLRAYRWRLLLAAVQEISFQPLFSATMIGFMGNNLLPARLGELLRAHSLGRATGVRRSTALASIVVERIFDIFILLILLGGILLLRPLKREIQSWGALLLILVLPVFALLLAYHRRPEPVLRAVSRLTPAKYRTRLTGVAENFREGLSVLTRGRVILWAFLCSVAMWGCFDLVVMLCFQALHLHLPPDAGLVVMVVMAIGTMIPSAPGYIGTLQYAGTLALMQYGVERSTALSFTLLYHVSQWIPVTTIGLAFFFRQQLTWGRWSRLAEAGNASEAPLRAEASAGGPPGERKGR